MMLKNTLKTHEAILFDAPIRKWARALKSRYGASVYLCGSALYKKHPRDWDVRISLSKEQFNLRYGNPYKWIDEGKTGAWTSVRWKWAKDCVKMVKIGWGLTKLNIDFQVYPIIYVRKEFAGAPRLKLA